VSDAPGDAPAVLRPGTWLVDARLAGMPETVGVFVQALPDGRVALIESASGATVPTVQASLATLGIGPDDVAAIVLTHVHLDHAAGAGSLSRWSGAPVHVHPAGLPHLADPSRLWSSAARLYGDAMDRLWGPMEPVPEERLQPLQDDEILELGGARYKVLHTPGHARHHLALLDPDGGAFVGDAAGILLPGVPLIRPALPPPETDLEAAEASCAHLAAADLERLYLTHFGVVTQVDSHLADVVRRNAAWGAEVRAGMDAGEDHETLVRRMRRLEDDELDRAGVTGPRREAYKLSSDARMTVLGLERYWRKREQA
jgi:glyoxylase-like metal-dependent hydrolase (beta-lactamase superfamily II)